MTEYLDYPHSLHIDASFGAEYDPYPGNRVRQASGRPSPSWISTGNLHPAQTSTPRVIPGNATSPIPTVHRLTRDYDAEPTRTPVALNTPLIMPGASRFRESDQVEATRWPMGSPTNVSYPATTRPSWMTGPGQASMRPHESAALFQPVQASTPAPSRYGDPRGYLDAPPRYGQPYQQPRRYGAAAADDTDSHVSSIERTYEPQHEEHVYEQPPREVDEREFEADMRSDSASGSEVGAETLEEEYIPVDAVVDDRQGMPGMLPEPSAPPVQTKGKKRFGGGFMSSLRNFTGLGAKATLPPLQIPASPVRGPPRSLYTSKPAVSDLGTNKRPMAPYPPRETPPAADHSLSTERTSQGPVTPDQSEHPITIPDLPEDVHLPNPHNEHEQIINVPTSPETPEEVDLQPTADYDAMTEPIEDEFGETTLSSHINRVGKFVTDLVHLPWITSGSVAAVYKPSESRRARHVDPKPVVSWYTKENHEKLDLLATPTRPVQRQQHTPTRARMQTSRPQRQAQRRQPTRQTRMPLSGTSTDVTSLDTPTPSGRQRNAPGSLSFSPALSPHVHGGQTMPYNYYYASPQALYMYQPPPATSPGRSGTDPQPAPMAMPLPIPMQMQNVAGGSGQPSAMPIYMVAAPAPMVLPNSSRQHHKQSHRKHGRHASSPPPHMAIPVIPTVASSSSAAAAAASPTTRSPAAKKSPMAQRSPARGAKSPMTSRSPGAQPP
jgi:hypothetical protein